MKAAWLDGLSGSLYSQAYDSFCRHAVSVSRLRARVSGGRQLLSLSRSFLYPAGAYKARFLFAQNIHASDPSNPTPRSEHSSLLLLITPPRLLFFLNFSYPTLLFWGLCPV